MNLEKKVPEDTVAQIAVLSPYCMCIENQRQRAAMIEGLRATRVQGASADH
jgi:hypothetical protein